MYYPFYLTQDVIENDLYVQKVTPFGLLTKGHVWNVLLKVNKPTFEALPHHADRIS